ncbi:hypothetical protein [Micromonospora sp. L31]|uniref:hypothetical protein n=1 Tax=Micromonospora sp. L31 TaxID=3452213 RepID=UPI003F8CEA4D
MLFIADYGEREQQLQVDLIRRPVRAPSPPPRRTYCTGTPTSRYGGWRAMKGRRRLINLAT